MNETPAGHDDTQLIASTLAGDREAFGQLVCRYQDRLFNGMVQVLRNEAEAEDTVQEAFIRALTRLDTFRGKSEFFTWLYRIAYNVAVTRIRRRKPMQSIDTAGATQPLVLPDDRPLPDDGLMRQERADQLMRALDRLSVEHRTILVLREMEDMDYAQLSEVLELPIGTVRSRLHRARLQLKELLESGEED